MTISEIIRERRTIREFNDKKVSLDTVPRDTGAMEVPGFF